MNNQRAQELFFEYLNRRYGDRSTPQHYKSDVAIFLKTVENKAVLEMTREDVAKFVDAQREKEMSAATINRRLAAVHSFFEFIASEPAHHDLVNPVSWRQHSPKQSKPIARDASDAEIECLFTQISDPRDEAIFGLMVGAGLRVGEVAELKIANLTAPQAPSKLAQLIVCGKGRKERVVWLTTRWYEQVVAYQQVRPESEEEMMFLNQRGQPIKVNGIQYRLRQYCSEADVYITCHQLRHTFARRLANQKMPIESISKLLGHEEIETTQRYTAGADPSLQEEFERLMAEESQPTPISSAAVQVTRSPRQRYPAPSEALENALERYAEFPEWLQEVLNAHLRHWWHIWKPHMAAKHAYQRSKEMCTIWRWFFSHFTLTDWGQLKREQVEEWLDHEIERGLAPSTVARNLSSLHSFLNFALDFDKPIHPALFRVKGPKTSARLPRSLDNDEYKLILQTMIARTENASDSLLQRTWFLTLAWTGIRLSELLDLRTSDLDLATRRLFIHESKNDLGRVVFLTPSLVQYLQTYLAWRPDAPTDHLFVYADGRQLTASAISSKCQRWATHCNITFSPHRLRHTFATRLLNQGLPLESIRRLLGHTSISMTQHYANLHDSTVLRHFEQASTYLEGIPIPDWPAHIPENVDESLNSV